MSKPEPVLPESVERVFDRLSAQLIKFAKSHAYNDRAPLPDIEDDLRRAIAAAILRAKADAYDLAWAESVMEGGVKHRGIEWRAQADALEKEPTDGA